MVLLGVDGVFGDLWEWDTNTNTFVFDGDGGDELELRSSSVGLT